MLRDKENHLIKICKTPNSHILILGKSGEGKTYFCCRKIEEDLEEGKKVIILDYSNSYSLPELYKCKFRYAESIQILNPFEKKTDFMFGVSGMESALSDLFINTLRILSYYQKKLLREAIFRVAARTKILTIPALIECIEEMSDEEISSESEKNIGHLLTRLGPYSELDNVRIIPGRSTCDIGKKRMLLSYNFRIFLNYKENSLLNFWLK